MRATPLASRLVPAHARLAAGRERPRPALVDDRLVAASTVAHAIGAIVPALARSGRQATDLRKSTAASVLPATGFDGRPEAKRPQAR